MGKADENIDKNKARLVVIFRWWLETFTMKRIHTRQNLQRRKISLKTAKRDDKHVYQMNVKSAYLDSELS